MPIVVSGIRIGLDQTEEQAIRKAIKKLKISHNLVKEAYVNKVSLDARRQNQITLVNTVCVELTEGELEAVQAASDSSVVYREKRSICFTPGLEKLESPIVIAGFGPAGMFAALTLARQGYRPIVLERGTDVDQRVIGVNRFWKQGVFDSKANVQFGEGGAGTFSDGKLTTRISDPFCDLVLKDFVNHGAPEEILKKAKPHIGTDKLRQVVKSIREEIQSLGGEIRFCSQLEGVTFQNNQLKSIRVNGEEIPASILILAIGHSARDTFSMLLESGVYLEPKAFSVGARIEHLQSEIDKGLYGKYAGHPLLPKGEYQLSYRKNGRGVYTFCMCPGGMVVPSSSCEGTVVTNGMSEFARDQKNANSALVVGVGPEDFGSSPLDGIKFQQRLEQQAFQLGGKDYRAPAATVGEFLNHRVGLQEKRVHPSYALGVNPVDFDRLFPNIVTQMMREGLERFGRKIPGFDASDAVLTGPETRTSSPVRITRGEDFCAVGKSGLYPCGEGAGYAGGIMSAAVDGIRIASAIIQKYQPYGG
ncbi:NAD(P)/FAD-dependent oxidoreductase [Massilioclostridium coli]|uniref:NAD(P)/FAD-dependent oxidoreductase n=1 Tax=Massilioclostridium coli TaxID=1870991 RepID=UPI00085CA04D|nr:hypothetical protein [Massilioclostridium coli]